MSNVLPNHDPKQPVVQRSLMEKMRQIIREDTSGLHPRLIITQLVLSLLPRSTANRLRAKILEYTGFGIGDGTLVRGMPRINGIQGMYQNLSIGTNCLIHPDCTFDLIDRITIGNRVTIGNQAMILTSSHEIGPKEHRAGKLMQAPVIIEDGVWIGPRSIILPGITIGEGAIITPGALVNKDVSAHTRVAGTPAKVIEALVRE
jgi:acetyltransferase-like isoleucine patch superfamily enzyme